MKRSSGLYAGMVAAIVVLLVISYLGIFIHTIAREPLMVNGSSVVASVLDNRQVAFEEYMTHTLVSMEEGRLLAVSASPGRTGIVITRRNPSDAEARLWRKYFSIGM